MNVDRLSFLKDMYLLLQVTVENGKHFFNVMTTIIKNMDLLSSYSYTFSTSKAYKLYFKFKKLSDFTDFGKGKSLYSFNVV